MKNKFYMYLILKIYFENFYTNYDVVFMYVIIVIYASTYAHILNS